MSRAMGLTKWPLDCIQDFISFGRVTYKNNNLIKVSKVSPSPSRTFGTGSVLDLDENRRSLVRSLVRPTFPLGLTIVTAPGLVYVKIITSFVPLTQLYSFEDGYEEKLGKNIVHTTVKKNHRKAWQSRFNGKKTHHTTNHLQTLISLK